MSLAVIRCPACGSAARVTADAIGQMVGCPRCQTPFVAAEDAAETPLPSRAGRTGRPSTRSDSRSTRGTTNRPAAVIPIAPPTRTPPEPPPREETESPRSESTPILATEVPDPEHDPHTPPVGGLPVSVLVGFALMPFGIPLLWFVGPMITGVEASLSLAVPVSLAVAAAALCLGVVYTIDWTATTRIKGVLMLVGLAYLSAAGLFFLKKDLMDRVQKLLGRSNDWGWVSANDRTWRIKMPRPAWSDEQQPLPGLAPMSDVRRAQYSPEERKDLVYEYCFAASKLDPTAPEPDGGWLARVSEQMWFIRVREQLLNKGKDWKLVGEEEPIKSKDSVEPDGRQWMFESADGRSRIVRVFVIKGRVYYLCAEGPELKPDDDRAGPFFNSFHTFEPLPLPVKK